MKAPVYASLLLGTFAAGALAAALVVGVILTNPFEKMDLLRAQGAAYKSKASALSVDCRRQASGARIPVTNWSWSRAYYEKYFGYEGALNKTQLSGECAREIKEVFAHRESTNLLIITF